MVAKPKDATAAAAALSRRADGKRSKAPSPKRGDREAGHTGVGAATPYRPTRQKFLSKVLRSLASDGPAGILARTVCGLSKRRAIDYVDNMTEEEFAGAIRKVRNGLPALAASGLLT